MRKYGKRTAERTAEERGFYIILILCVAAIAISGYVLFFAPLSGGASMEDVEYTPDLPHRENRAQTAASITEQQESTSTPPVDTVLPEDIPGIEDTNGGQTAAAAPQPQQPSTQQPSTQQQTAAQPEEPTSPAQPQPQQEPEQQPTAAPAWVKPVKGEIAQEFSGDKLVYQKTLGDWRVHAGTDYLAPSGTRVYAVSDGEVTDVVSDSLWGVCVTIKLENGQTAIYRGLSEKPKVKKDSTVKAGDVIGSVANVVPAEADTGAHLHLELKDKDGKSINPEQ